MRPQIVLTIVLAAVTSTSLATPVPLSLPAPTSTAVGGNNVDGIWGCVKKLACWL
ncbi:hypothetical protein CPB86DRAFT_778140 [Serendipita vermifera]|nr:hypothetical protein CPB86DRAFT_778140 [Serendipita vermifera]